MLALVAPLSCAADSLKDADDSAGQFIKIQIEEARLQTEWSSQRELLVSLVHADQDRAAALEESRDLMKAKTASTREELDAMRSKIDSANDDAKVLDTRLRALSAQLLSLRPSLPPRLSEALEMSFRTLADSKVQTGERMQVAMNVLNRCAEFNRMVTVGEEVLSLEGEPPEKSVEVIYWGLSRGYVADRANRKAWLGAPGPNGWAWESKPEAFDSVARLIDVAQNKADPEYVRVPAEVPRSLTANAGN